LKNILLLYCIIAMNIMYVKRGPLSRRRIKKKLYYLIILLYFTAGWCFCGNPLFCNNCAINDNIRTCVSVRCCIGGVSIIIRRVSLQQRSSSMWKFTGFSVIFIYFFARTFILWPVRILSLSLSLYIYIYYLYYIMFIILCW